MVCRLYTCLYNVKETDFIYILKTFTMKQQTSKLMKYVDDSSITDLLDLSS